MYNNVKDVLMVVVDSIYVTHAPPLGNNTNSENGFVLFFSVDYFGIVAKRK